MMGKLATLFVSLGWSRDDAKWLWVQMGSVAALIASGVFNVEYWATYLGITLTPIELHWIQALAVLTLWVSGKMDSSHLPSAETAATMTALKKVNE
jgi:hypothetical protein